MNLTTSKSWAGRSLLCQSLALHLRTWQGRKTVSLWSRSYQSQDAGHLGGRTPSPWIYYTTQEKTQSGQFEERRKARSAFAFRDIAGLPKSVRLTRAGPPFKLVQTLTTGKGGWIISAGVGVRP